MDLFIMRYSTNTVGEHRTETRSNNPGYNGVFVILKSSNFAKTKISPYEPPWLQDPNSYVLKSMDFFTTIYSNNTVGEHRIETRPYDPAYNRVFFILKPSNFAKTKISPD